MSFKENLRDEMEFQDVKPKELSDKTGISVNTIRNYINGHNALPNVDVAVKIAKALGVSVEYLVLGKEESIQKIPPKIHYLEKALLHFSQEDLNAVFAVTKAIEEKYD